jgi:hypothetical protein
MLAYKEGTVLEKKVASTTSITLQAEQRPFEHLTLLEKRNLLICEKRLERLSQFLECL